METYRLKNIAILILLLLNAFLLMLLGYQYMQSRQSDEDMLEQMHVLFSGNQLSLSDSVDLLQPVLSPLTLSRSTEMEANMADALLGEDVESASQGGGADGSVVQGSDTGSAQGDSDTASQNSYAAKDGGLGHIDPDLVLPDPAEQAA